MWLPLPGCLRSEAAEVRALAPVVRAWGMRAWEVRERLGGTDSMNWKVEHGGEAFVLRRVRDERAYLDFQIAVMRCLAASGFPYEVPEVVRPSAGADRVERDDGTWLLLRYIHGDDAPEPTTREEARAVGVLVAEYGRAVTVADLAEYGQAFPLRLFETEAVAAVLSRSTGRVSGALGHELDEHVGALLEAYRDLPDSHVAAVDDLPRLAAYCDWHRYNRVVRAGRIQGLIDFDSLMWAPRVVDFQGALSYVMMSTPEPSLLLIRAFAEGYGRVWPLTFAEAGLVPSLLLDRLLWLLADIVEDVQAHGPGFRDDLGARLIGCARWLTANEDPFAEAVQAAASGGPVAERT